LQTSDKKTITIDLKQTTMIPLPQFIQHDTNILEFVIMENGANADLTNIGRIVVKYKRPDGEVIPRLLVAQGNIITYQIGQSEMAKSGYGIIEIHFYSLDNIYRISTKKFKVYISESVGASYIESENLTLLQELFVEVYNVNSQIEATEEIRKQNEITRQSQEALRQTNTSNKINEIETRTTAAIGRVDAVVNENKTIWLSPVANFAAIATTYPNALDGSQVLVTDDAPGVQNQYRKINGSWIWTGRYRDNALVDLQNRLNDANRQSQTLVHGTQVINATQNSPVDVEIQGRTLTSLGNSNLEANKNYVLADKKFKIKAEGREGTVISGVGKFIKSNSLVTKADFSGKVSGSVVENPHKSSAKSEITLTPPSGFSYEPTQALYDRVKNIDGALYYQVSNSENGKMTQQLFSFNIIEQIERKMGRIPSDTLAGKVQWVKDNVAKLTTTWHGFGLSVGGNRASLSTWATSTNAWLLTGSPFITNTSSTVGKLTVADSSNVPNRITSDGFVHYLAFAEPSDGTTPSVLNTDFIELEIELKSTAVLDTRPIVTRVANFEGKVSGSVVENPHVSKYRTGSTSLVSPDGSWTGEIGATSNVNIQKLDGLTTQGLSASTPGAYAQQLFSFDLIAEVERNIGRIPKATVAEKVQWLKENVESVRLDWYGFGSSVGGNKAKLARWSISNSNWTHLSDTSHTNSSVSPLTLISSTSFSIIAGTDGFVHYLAYAEPSDGTTPSTINTDYVELQITLKPGATLHDPVLPLYEVDATEYANILVGWNEAEVMNRYPKVQGTQHLQNLAIIAEGENLLPPFSDSRYVISGFNITSPYELRVLNGSPYANIDVVVVPNTNYILDSGTNGYGRSRVTGVTTGTILSSSVTKSRTFNSGNNTVVTIGFDRGSSVTEEAVISNPMLTLGSTPKPFVPRNPSYLYAPVKLGQIGSVKDSLFKQNGDWQLVERVKKDVVLDTSMSWTVDSIGVGFKTVYSNKFVDWANSVNFPTITSVVKYDGKMVKVNGNQIGFFSNDIVGLRGTSPYSLAITISNVDTGFGETYNPLTDEIKAYFNGWQAKTVDANGKPTAWRSLGDGSDAPTQTLTYVSANRAPNYTPYRLSYVLVTPQTTVVNHLVEGDIAVSGPTQVEVTSGVVVREKVVPALGVTSYNLNNKIFAPSLLKNKVQNIMAIYRNSLKDTSPWMFVKDIDSFGNQRAYVHKDYFDPTAEYTVTYLVLDRHQQSLNATEVKVSYSGSLKDTVDMNTERLADALTQQSILNNQMYRVLVALKGASINV
jgi:hypothetical protein